MHSRQPLEFCHITLERDPHHELFPAATSTLNPPLAPGKRPPDGRLPLCGPGTAELAAAPVPATRARIQDGFDYNSELLMPLAATS